MKASQAEVFRGSSSNYNCQPTTYSRRHKINVTCNNFSAVTTSVWLMSFTRRVFSWIWLQVEDTSSALSWCIAKDDVDLCRVFAKPKANLLLLWTSFCVMTSTDPDVVAFRNLCRINSKTVVHGWRLCFCIGSSEIKPFDQLHRDVQTIGSETRKVIKQSNGKHRFVNKWNDSQTTRLEMNRELLFRAISTWFDIVAFGTP